MGGGKDGQGYTAVRCAWKHITLQKGISLIAKEHKLFGTVKVNLCFILSLAFLIFLLFPPSHFNPASSWALMFILKHPEVFHSILEKTHYIMTASHSYNCLEVYMILGLLVKEYQF